MEMFFEKNSISITIYENIKKYMTWARLEKAFDETTQNQRFVFVLYAIVKSVVVSFRCYIVDFDRSVKTRSSLRIFRMRAYTCMPISPLQSNNNEMNNACK